MSKFSNPEAQRDLCLILMDAENLTGTPIPSSSQLSQLELQIKALFPGVTAHCVLACNHLAAPCLFGWKQPVRRILASGPNGADMALIEAENAQEIPKKYSRVVIGSGDHIFAPFANYLRKQGVEVIVVARQGSLSRVLAQRATRVLILPHPELPFTCEIGLAA